MQTLPNLSLEKLENACVVACVFQMHDLVSAFLIRMPKNYLLFLGVFCACFCTTRPKKNNNYYSFLINMLIRPRVYKRILLHSYEHTIYATPKC